VLQVNQKTMLLERESEEGEDSKTRRNVILGHGGMCIIYIYNVI
jgi:hypothetical protein